MIKEYFAKQVWMSVSIIIASIAITAGALFFLSENISAQAAMIASDRVTIQQKTDAVADLAQLETDVPQAAEYQSAIDQLLPNQYGLVTFTQWLAQLGAKYGVTTDAAFQGAVTSPTGSAPGTAQFTFSAEGSSDDLSAFLDGMNAKSSGFIVSLASFDVSADGSDEKVSGQGTIFFQ